MNFYRKSFVSVLLLFFITMAYAQSGTNSPYSQYGLGQLTEQSSGFNRGMNGLALGFREHNQVNYMNPASYSSIDSLTFIFDVGLSGQLTNFKEGTQKINARNGDFEYAVAGFRAFKHVGVSFGIIPFTNVGYSYAVTDYLGDTRTTTYTNTYSGSGGIHEIFLGAGWEPFKGFSIGANIGYIWGDITRYVTNSYSDSYVNTLSKYYKSESYSYDLDFGVQYSVNINKKNNLTIGVTYGLGHKLGTDPECLVISNNPSTGVADTTSFSVKNGYEIPTTIGGGFVWIYKDKWKVGADVNYQKWGSIGFPVYNVVNDVQSYELSSNYYKDRYKFTAGGEFCANENSRRFIDRVHFRLGTSYVTPYYKVNGYDGPSEFSISAGFGIPIVNAYNNRSILNISGQWVHSSAKDMLTENTFRINVGITFNERWFMKWKFE
ncbi:MAG: hypothetical protein LUC88_08300 [Prevotella sp.]|nr:hypothetical protein [Prevotella sp.]